MDTPGMDTPGERFDHELTLQYREHPGYDATAEKNRTLLTSALDALAEGDSAPFWAIFDPDVTFHEASCLPYGGVYQGIEATRRAHGNVSSHYSSMRSVMEAVLASRDIVILYQTITFEVAANGNTGSLPVAEVFRFRNGKVIEWRALYFDAGMVARALAGD